MDDLSPREPQVEITSMHRATTPVEVCFLCPMPYRGLLVISVIYSCAG